MEGYKLNNQKMGDHNLSLGNKMSCVFTTTSGKSLSILIEHGKTINELIKIYFLRVERPDLMDKKQDISFIYNASQINIDSQQKVEKFFKLNENPRITVNDIHNLIGAISFNYYFKF